MSQLIAAAYTVLRDSSEPLHYTEIFRRMVERNLWAPRGRTPAVTVNNRLNTRIRRDPGCVFRRTGPGMFAVREGSAKLGDQLVARSRTLSFSDAAQRVLAQNRSRMHYTAIAESAIAQGLIQTRGITPEATIHAQIIQDIDRRRRQGEPQRFVRYGSGMIGLVAWEAPLGEKVDRRREITYDDIERKLDSLTAAGFEELTGELLAAMGFTAVSVTRLSGDAGVDVRGTLVTGGVIEAKMAVQVKRWKKGNNVRSPTVRELRGSLGVHEQGMIITTSSFSRGAREDAMRSNAIRIWLLDRQGLVGLLYEHRARIQALVGAISAECLPAQAWMF